MEENDHEELPSAQLRQAGNTNERKRTAPMITHQEEEDDDKKITRLEAAIAEMLSEIKSIRTRKNKKVTAPAKRRAIVTKINGVPVQNRFAPLADEEADPGPTADPRTAAVSTMTADPRTSAEPRSAADPRIAAVPRTAANPRTAFNFKTAADFRTAATEYRTTAAASMTTASAPRSTEADTRATVTTSRNTAAASKTAAAAPKTTAATSKIPAATNRTKTVSPKTSTIPTAGTASNSISTAAEATNGTTGKTRRPPPIVLHDKPEDHQVFDQMIQLSSKTHTYKYTNQGLRVYAQSREEFDAIKHNIAQNTEMNFHSYTPKEDKPLSMVLRGLPKLDSMDIMGEITHTHPEIVITAISHMNTPRTGHSLYKLDFQNGTSVRAVTNIRYLYSCKVYWQKYNTRGYTTQCFNCQEFGHAAKNCYALSRCVKCGQEHETRQCIKNPDTPATCCNCNGAHPANYRQCPSYLDYVERTHKSTRNAQPQTKPKYMPAPQPTSNPWAPPPEIAEIDQQASTAPSTEDKNEMLYYINGIQKLWPKFSAAKDKFEKAQVVINFLESIK